MKHAAGILVTGLGLAACLATACVGSAWRETLHEDSSASYLRFLRAHPDSPYEQQARAHLEFLRVKRNPDSGALADFRKRFPDSPLLVELQPLIEQVAFDAARGWGSATAYQRFVRDFPNSSLAGRAAGNAAYLSNRQGKFDVDALVAFASEYPESDYSAEALRSAASLSFRDSTAFDLVGLSVDVSDSTPEADRIRRAFSERAVAQYKAARIRLVELPASGPLHAHERAPAARLEIRHTEQKRAASQSGHPLGSPLVVGETSVTLRIGSEQGPVVWQRRFELRSEARLLREGASLLFSSVAESYWSAFFVPTVRWQSNRAIRVALNLAKPVSALDGSGSRAVVLFRDGDLQVLDLADPASPVVLAQYVRERSGRDFSQWSGVRVLGDRVALFGDDGLEIVRWEGGAPETALALGRGEIGSLVAVERLDRELIVAGSQGLLLVEEGGAAPKRLLRRRVRGMAKLGNGLVFTDGESLFLSTVSLLRQGRVSAQLHLGRGFGPERLRAFDSTVVVIGASGVAVLDATNPSQPRLLSQLYTRQLGRVVDAGSAMGRVFLLGERGLQALDAGLSRVDDSVDLGMRGRAIVLGRHLVASGEAGVQVVDLTPFVTSAMPARPE